MAPIIAASADKMSKANFMAYDLADLKLIVAIADYGSLTRAAEGVCLATSSASSRLANLEAALEAVLFIRHRRGLKPTTAGEVALRHARQVLVLLGQLESDLSARHQPNITDD